MRNFVKIQKRDFLKIRQVRIFSSGMKLGCCNFIQVYLYMVSENTCNRFLNFRFFGNITGYVHYVHFWHFPNFVHNFVYISKKKSKIQKSVQWIFRYHTVSGPRMRVAPRIQVLEKLVIIIYVDTFWTN